MGFIIIIVVIITIIVIIIIKIVVQKLVKKFGNNEFCLVTLVIKILISVYVGKIYSYLSPTAVFKIYRADVRSKTKIYTVINLY